MGHILHMAIFNEGLSASHIPFLTNNPIFLEDWIYLHFFLIDRTHIAVTLKAGKFCAMVC